MTIEINKGICPICKFTYNNMIGHLMREKDSNHKQYINNLNIIVDKLILDTDLYIQEIVDEIKKQKLFISSSYVMNRIKLIEPNRKHRVLSTRRMGENNPIFRGNAIEKIKKNIKDKWVNGHYKNRINGMLGKVKELHPNYNHELHIPSEEAKRFYSDFLNEFEIIDGCKRCNCREFKIDIHHVDEDHNNFLPSNLEPLCVPCHQQFHTKEKKLPFVTIAKKLSFASAHNLPHYIGACENFHGHEWFIEVGIRRRIDPATEMVMDFKDLTTIMKTHIIDILDHNVINDFILIPTAENIIVWCWEKLMFDGYLKGIEYIKLWESPDSYATLTKQDMLSVFKEKIDKKKKD